MNKCNHDWEVSPDQSDTGTMGVRMKCRHCLRVTTKFNPLKQHQPKGGENNE